MSTNVGSIHYDLNLDTRGFDEGIKGVSNKLRSVGDSMTQFGRTMTTHVTLPIVGFTAGMVASAAALEKTSASFNVLVGEGTKARKLFADIKKFADTTPFEFPELAKATTTMLGYGVAAEDVLDRLKRLGDAAAASGGDLNGITLAYSQMIGRGKVTGDNLRQLTENMVTLRSELSQVSGVPMNQLDKAIEGGLITIDMLNEALDLATNKGGKFFGGTEKLAQTFSGRLSTVKDQLLEVGRNLIGVKVDPELGLTVQEGGVFDRLSKLLPKIAEAAKKLGDAFASLSPVQQNVAVGGTAAAAAAGPLALLFGSMAKNLSALIPLMANPAFWIVAGILAAIAGIVALIIVNWKQLQSFYKTNIIPMWEDFVRYVTPAVDKIVEFTNTMSDYLLPLLEDSWNFMVNQFGPAWDDVTAGIGRFMNEIKPTTDFIGQVFLSMITGMGQALVLIGGILGFVASGIFYVIGALARLVGWIINAKNILSDFISSVRIAILNGLAQMARIIGNFVNEFFGAGVNIIGGFVRGIVVGFVNAKNAVLDGLRNIRRLLPFSPAKEGPFSGKGWTLYSGQSLMQGFAEGIKANSSLPQLALDNALSNAQLSVNAIGNQTPVNNTSTSININGDITLSNRDAVNQFFGQLNRNNELSRKGLAVI